MNKQLIAVVSLLNFSFPAWAVPQNTLIQQHEEHFKERPPLILGQGEQRLLRFPGLHRYSLGSSVVRSFPLGRNFGKLPILKKEGLLLKAVTPGMGDLWVWKTDGTAEHRTIRVEKIQRDDRNPQLERALGKLEEAEVIFAGIGTVLRGEIQSFEESAKIAALRNAFPQLVHDETEPSEDLLNAADSLISGWLRKTKLSTQLRIERIGTSLWIRGSLNTPQEQKDVEKQIRALYPLAQLEIDSLPDRAQTVYFKVFLLELKRSQFQSLGMAWPSMIPGAFKVTPGGIQSLFQMDIMIQQLEGKGSARILSNPELVVRAPGEAELFAGGELPIQNQSQYYSNVTWKNYGLTLRLKVTHIAGDRVRLDIFTEVSHLDAHIAQNKIPGIQANRMKTQVDAKFGTPLLLSGLLQQGIREEAKGLPLLRGLPILGPLFGSDDYLNERSELVAILYPQSTPPAQILNQSHWIPRGPLPSARNWLTPQDMRELQESKDYPWNALE